MRSRWHRSFVRIAGAGMMMLPGLPFTEAAEKPPARSLAQLDATFTTAIQDLARRAAAAGDESLAKLISTWPLPAAHERQNIVRIPATVEKPETVDTPDEETVWSDFVAVRRSRAAGLFEHAVFVAAAHDRPLTRDELANPAADALPLSQRSCEAIRLLHEALRDDPHHERARAAGGWIRRGDEWLWPEAAKRLDRGEAYDPSFGWMPKAKLERYRAGERPDRGRWVPVADDEARPRDVKHGREFHSDHWEIVSAAGLADARVLADKLEETHDAWRQVFGAYAIEPSDLEKRLAGRGRTLAHTPHSAILCAGRGQYVSELEPFESRVGMTNGIYWTPTKTIWFFAEAAADPPEPDPITIHHEATHQLFTESRADSDKGRQQAGERCGFWAIEAAACYMESLQPTDFGWTVGGRDAGRVPAAKDRLDEAFYVPFADLCGMGRKDFQSQVQLQQIYSQIAGQADFLMNGVGGRYRESFVEYLTRVYRGTADPDTLARLCKRSYADLDDEYRRHVLR